MELIELRQAMRAIYAERSLSISDCYKLEKIHKVECIYYNLEDKTSKQLAEILQKQIEAYSFQPVLIQGITFNLIANNYYLGWKEALRFISIEKKDAQKTLVLCNSIVARILLEFASIDEMSGRFNIPDYILDINEYKNEGMSYWKKVPLDIAKLKEQKAIYTNRSYKITGKAVILLSSLEYINKLKELSYNGLDTIILVNDCPQAPQWFVKRQINKFNHSIATLFPKIFTKQYTQAEFKKEISTLDSAIMFVPQNKTWWKYYASSEVSFWIDADDISDFDDFGPMDFQSFCEDIVQFAEISPQQQAAQNFLKFYKRKKFNCLNRFVYWLRQ